MSVPAPELGPRSRLDLHMHSNRSDGRYAPEDVLARCAAGGLDVVALTDHDQPPAWPAGVVTVGQRTLRVVHGAEISAMHGDEELHLLVYFPGQMPESFAEFCRERSRRRADRYAEAIERLGLDGVAPPDERSRAGDRALTRYHLASALTRAGHATGVGDAFERVLNRKPDPVPHLDLSWAEAIAVARDCGGYTSWAHPPVEQARAWTGAFAKLGLHALEATRPQIGQGVRDTLSRTAFKHGLGVTGGSDWHGWHAGELGAFSFPMRQAFHWARALGFEA